jgi:hypothetical protein
MQEAAVVLSVLRERGRKALPLTQPYRQMVTKHLYLLFGMRQHLLQPGGDDAGRQRGNRRWHVRGKDRPDHRADAVRAVPALPGPPHLHPEKNGKLRSLGLPPWSDELVGGVVRLLLEAYYEPRFSGQSHGFRK